MLKDNIQAALGRLPLDLVIKGNMVNTLTGEIEETGVAIFNGNIVGIGDYDANKVIRCNYFCPGFIDGHVHIESSMLSPVEFSRAVAPRGTTAIVADPHEIANATGFEGLCNFIEDAGSSYIKIFFTAPSCVPASPLEMSYSIISAEEIKKLFAYPSVIGIGEMMNFKGLLDGEQDILDKLGISRIIDGHAPGLTGRELNAYISAGVGSDHESVTLDEGLEKVRKGMWLMVREGACTKNLKEVIHVADKIKDTRRIMLVTDDRDSLAILAEGHMDHLVREAINEGIDPVRAIQMATINPAERFGLPLGAIMPGYPADIILLDDIEKLKIEDVLINGRPFSSAGFTPVYPREARKNTVHIPDISKDDIAVRCDRDRLIRVIGVQDNSIYTDEIMLKARCSGFKIAASPDNDLLKICSIRRYPGPKKVSAAFVKGFGIKRGAVAQTISHDSHNVIALGANDDDIINAVRRLKEIRGGIVISDGGRISCELSLPYGGLMADMPVKEIARIQLDIKDKLHEMGSGLENPAMRLSFLGLSVVPELKLTCNGLVDVRSQKIVSIFADED
ncbi:adenine deaminase [Methanocella sp. CWC-04]|uniref:Adenine deaminase n=1 Tax=Methanooceanicella nereidis TaxID=2052831 RepID=A0AAP2RDQ1_9EURY|nr:adenine deaminase [Methanocella sp. CWC-04]MCD1295222.1 adenine deaminase [Methanocella sp. CWC-04]